MRFGIPIRLRCKKSMSILQLFPKISLRGFHFLSTLWFLVKSPLTTVIFHEMSKKVLRWYGNTVDKMVKDTY
jgi:hypothetical protein